MTKYRIIVWSGDNINRCDGEQRENTASLIGAKELFKDVLEYEKKTIDLYTVSYVAVSLEKYDLDSEQEEIIDSIETLEYIELKDKKILFEIEEEEEED